MPSHKLYHEAINQMVSLFFSATRTGFPMIAISLKDTVDIEWREAIEVLRLSCTISNICI
jgi:hypothetical protein